MKRHKITEKLNQQIIELQNSRNNIEDYSFNFLNNIYRHAALIHKLIEIRLETDLLEVATSQYLISLVSCWETFFRDTFVFIASKDTNFRKEIINLVGVKQEVVDSLERDNLIAGFLSKSFNFQNFEDIESSFSPIFDKQMFTTIGNHIFLRLGLNGQLATNFCYEAISPNYIELIKQVYEVRHNITHDANYPTNLEIDLIQKTEASFVVFPQLFTIWMSDKMHLPLTTDDNKDQDSVKQSQVVAPYIFTINDILRTDWVVVPETD
jgi:hypothetical protein